MNMAVRTESNSPNAEIESEGQSIQAMNVFVSLLLVLVLFSAIGVVYLKDYNRRMYIDSQSLQRTISQQISLAGKLMLEQSAWSAQTRIQQLAEKKLSMHAPIATNTVYLYFKNK
jgi:cell division protein FtsL